jgi:ubiquitin-protein ligase
MLPTSSRPAPANARHAAIMNAQYRAAVREPNEFLKFYMCEENTSIWYVLISGIEGNENEYMGGEYIVRIELPNDFPYNPPHFYFMTEQGLYTPERKVCISIGEFHKSNYRAALGVAGFCEQLVSGLVGWKEIGHGISIVETTTERKRQLAQVSCEFNTIHNGQILAKINSAYKDYSSKWDLTKVPEAMKRKLGLPAGESSAEQKS